MYFHDYMSLILGFLIEIELQTKNIPKKVQNGTIIWLKRNGEEPIELPKIAPTLSNDSYRNSFEFKTIIHI